VGEAGISEREAGADMAINQNLRDIKLGSGGRRKLSRRLSQNQSLEFESAR
jgi:hypothetical protein